MKCRARMRACSCPRGESRSYVSPPKDACPCLTMKIVLTLYLQTFTIRHMGVVCQGKIERALDILNCIFALSMPSSRTMNHAPEAQV